MQTRSKSEPSGYLLEMPKNVLFGEAARIEAWCATRSKVVPTLQDLENARRHRMAEAPRWAFSKPTTAA